MKSTVVIRDKAQKQEIITITPSSLLNTINREITQLKIYNLIFDF